MSDRMATMINLAKELVRADDEIASIEESLKALQKRRRTIAEELLPEAMDELDLLEFKTEGGRVIKVETKVQAHISEAHREAAHDWCRNTGRGDLIKTLLTTEFGRGEEEKAQELFNELSRRADLSDNSIAVKETIHHSTLRAMVKRALEDGEDIPMEIFGVHEIRVAKVDSSKARGRRN